MTGRFSSISWRNLVISLSILGVAAASGQLRLGDRILSVNGSAASGHAGTTFLLKEAVGSLRLRVQRPSQEESSLPPSQGEPQTFEASLALVLSASEHSRAFGRT